jgi:hypothetical protein
LWTDTTGVHTQSSRFLVASWWPVVTDQAPYAHKRHTLANAKGKLDKGLYWFKTLLLPHEMCSDIAARISQECDSKLLSEIA